MGLLRLGRSHASGAGDHESGKLNPSASGTILSGAREPMGRSVSPLALRDGRGDRSWRPCWTPRW